MARYRGNRSYYDLWINLYGEKVIDSINPDLIPEQRKIYGAVINLPLSILLSKSYARNVVSGHYYISAITSNTAASAAWFGSSELRPNGMVVKNSGYSVRCVAKVINKNCL